MIINDHPYISPKIIFKRRLIKRFLTGKFLPGLYVVRFANDPDQLEIIKSEYYKQKEIMKEDKRVVAIVKSYDEALNYVCEVTDLSIKEYGEPLIKEYLTR